LSTRVYALAKQLGVESKRLVTICQEAGLPVKSHMSSLDEQQCARMAELAKADAAQPVKAADKKPAAKSKAKKPEAKPAAKKKAAKPAAKKKAKAPAKAKPDEPPKAEPAPKAAPVAKPAPAAPKGARPPRPRGRFAPVAEPTEAEQPRGRWDRFAAPSGQGGRRRRGRRIRPRRPVGRRRSGPPRPTVPIDKATVEAPITVKALSSAIGVKVNQLIASLMKAGVMVTINGQLDEEAAMTVAMEHGVDLTVKRQETADDLVARFVVADEPEQLKPRSPVVTMLGHVDHGKTSLLDAIRRTSVVDSESGGITQHIGAYRVPCEGGSVTFLDTPGHEAFTAMRARGANVTDIVVLVVAADDGIMPQTEEAIAHARAADVPILVAINKIDKGDANVNRVFQQMSAHDLIPEEWGGDTVVVKTSATTGEGIEDLIEHVMLLAELQELKANPDKPAVGNCLEANRHEGRGVLATLLVREGTLNRGDVVVCGHCEGRIRAVYDENDRPLKSAGPGAPVRVAGLDDVPEAGAQFVVAPSVEKAREIAMTRQQAMQAEQIAAARGKVTLENLFEHIQAGQVKELPLILKVDVRGSLEAIRQELDKLKHDEVKLRVIYEGVGGINESDVQLADVSGAIVIGFHVQPDDRARALADHRGVDVRIYHVIYELTDQLRNALEGLLEPEKREAPTGRIEVRQIFKISRLGTIAGGYVREGTVSRNNRVRLWRDNVSIYEGAIDSLRRFKDDVRDVREGFECGVKIAGYDDIKVGDVVEAYRIESIKRTL